MVITVDRGRYRVLISDREVTATKARQLGRKGVIVGDRVRVVGDTSGEEGAGAHRSRSRSGRRCCGARPMTTTRTSDRSWPTPISSSSSRPRRSAAAYRDDRPHPGCRVRRRHPAAALPHQGRSCVARRARRQYEPLGVPVEVVFPGADLDPLRARLHGHRSVFVGHSGVGKSTLVNALILAPIEAIGAVNVVTGRGRHISSSAIALRLPDSTNSWVIDTPGVRSFGLRS